MVAYFHGQLVRGRQLTNYRSFFSDKNGWIDNLMKKHQQCLDKSGYLECPEEIKSKYEGLISSQKTQLQTILNSVNQCSQLQSKFSFNFIHLHGKGDILLGLTLD